MIGMLFENPKITLSMVVKNEGDRYLRRMLEDCKQYIHQAVIIDDGSTDHTVDVIQETLEGIPLKLIENPSSTFANEILLRKQQWNETIATSPEWIISLDADEIFEEGFKRDLPALVQQDSFDVIYFRLYDMWSETHYREDHIWKAHHMFRPFLLRYKPNIEYQWKETPQHCGRFPETILQFPYSCANARLKHYGCAKREDRIAKYERCMKLDPDGKYGWLDQYKSFLDENPNLVSWEEEII